MKDILEDLNPAERDDVVASATNIMADKLWQRVFERVERYHIARIKAEPTYNLTAVQSHASLQVLDQVRKEIELAASAERIIRKRNVRS